MQLKRISHIDESLGSQIAALISTLNDVEMDINAFVGYLIESTETIGLFGAFENNCIIGLIYIEPPDIIYPNKGYLFLTIGSKKLPHRKSLELLEMAKRWSIEQGATYLWGWTKRSPRAIKRLGVDVVKERQVILPLVGNDYLNVEIE